MAWRLKIGKRAFPLLTSILRLLLFLVGATLLLDQLEALQVAQVILISPNKAMTAALLVAAFFHWAIFRGRMPSNGKTWWLLAFYFSLFMSSGYAIAQRADPVLQAILWTTYLAMFFFYFLLCYTLRSRRDLDVFILGLFVSGLIATISAFILEGSGGEWGPERRSGVGSGENQAAGNLLMILPFIFALSYRRSSILARVALYGVAALLVAGFAMTLSRSGFLAALAMGALWMLRMRRLSDLRIVFAGAMLVAVAFLVSPAEYGERLGSLKSLFGETGNAYSDEIDYRASIYRLGLEAFLQNPVLGVGTEQFRAWAVRLNPMYAGIHEIHNAVLKVAANQGLLGLVPYLALLISTFTDLSKAQRIARRLRHHRDMEMEQLYLRAVTAQVGFVGILTVAMFQPGTFWRGVWAMFAISTVLVELVRQRASQLDVGQGVAGPRSNPSGGLAPSTWHPGSFPA